ncbi:hypothetical protein MLD38_005244 [Melastoma candidum]|uniref:Uncharacterized protein n=1 Tax=Melastoma candidum TaxID=119954 RepID=A0ACB9S9I0_9MYRT|nr:hypothetical protein MLD38_005244 [Melastoma candidum]
MKGEGRGCGREEFPGFPFEPYSIQVEFMSALYRFLDEGGVSMLESPTGTGKTLSIICSALQWLVDRKERKTSGSEVGGDGLESASGACSDDEPDWMRNFNSNGDKIDVTGTKKKDEIGFASNRSGRRGNCRNMCSGKEKIYGSALGSKSGEKADVANMSTGDETEDNSRGEDNGDDEFLVDDYESEEDGEVGAGLGSRRSKRKVSGLSGCSSSEEEGEMADLEEEDCLKIYFCSRTHSQLSQFVRELKRTSFAKEIQVVSLGSRKNFCINEEVLRLGSSAQINEKCLELQKNKKNDVSKTKKLGMGRVRRTKASSGCPVLSRKKLQREFKDLALQEGPLDIEELVHLGDSLGACPYYGTRNSVPVADLVVLPYQSLLSKASRESLGLNLKNNVVIIDEAHNLADSLISMYDSKIAESQLADVHLHLEKYLEHFRNLLGHGNRRYIQMLMVVTKALLRALEGKNDVLPIPYTNSETIPGKQLACCSSVTINEFLFSSNIDNINLVKLLHYMKESNIKHKVSGFGKKMASLDKGPTSDNVASGENGSTLSNFQLLADMLFSLTNKDSDGRIIISRATTTSLGQQESFIKYVMLTGEKIFAEIADQAHAVILAGGTLQPIEETRERLFPWLPLENLRFFSCGHIVPPESIMPIVISRGPSGRYFDFSYGSRSSPVLIEELGLLLCNLATIIPEGMVVFFSSFDYEAKVFSAWKDTGILDRIAKKKRVFREPRKSTEVELVLKEYKETIERVHSGKSKDLAPQNGAVLLAVVGGKVSEGINFSDGMGRCVLMVGLPYPNPSDIELMERVKHIEGIGDRKPTAFDMPDYDGHDDRDYRDGFTILRNCSRRGKEYYENLCMKAVNQSIGRAIRHRGDYAAILLVDKRYTTDPSRSGHTQPTDKLPKWIKDRLVHTATTYGEVHRLLHQFFKFNHIGKIQTRAG